MKIETDKISAEIKNVLYLGIDSDIIEDFFNHFAFDENENMIVNSDCFKEYYNEMNPEEQKIFKPVFNYCKDQENDFDMIMYPI